MTGTSSFWRTTTAFLVCILATPATATVADHFESRGGVEEAGREEDGTSWFHTWSEGIRFVLPREHENRREALWNLLETAYDAGRSITVRFAATGARFNAQLGRFEFRVCSVELEQVQVTIEAACGASQSGQALSAVDRIALAVAEGESGNSSETIPTLSASLESDELAPELRKLALKMRAEAFKELAYSEQPRSDRADQAWLAAFKDLQKLTGTSDSADLQLDIGYVLQELGDYEAARTVYERVIARWPDEDYNATVRLGALARQQGDYVRALNLINGLVERYGPDQGMKFYYHRGWTLTRLGRFDEAIADLTKGFATQPDYSYAYFRRACAFASVGDLDRALSDVQVGARFLSAVPNALGQPSIRHDLARATAIAAELKERIATGGSPSVTSACTGYWGDSDQPRKKSPLLAQR